MLFSNWLKTSQSGYGVVLVLMVLVSSMLLASSFKFTRGTSLNNQATALQNNSIATQVANYGLEAFRADVVTQLKAGTSITTSYRYPSSGTNNVSVPDDPSNLSGASSAVGNYFGTVTQVRGNYYLLGVTAVAGSSTVTASRLIDITIASAAGDVRFIGRNASDYTGNNVCSLGDVDGDGYDDLMMGADGADGGGSASGETYLVLGRSNASWKALADASMDFNLDNMSDANSTVRFIGRNAGDSVFNNSGAGDVDGDGYDDLMMGAAYADGGGANSGEAYLVLGRSKTNWQALTDVSGDFNLDNTSDANLTVRFIGRNAGDEMGSSVSDVGDVNNDGYKDVILGAHYADGGGSNSGETYLILGRSTTDWATLTDASGNFDLDNLSDANLTVRFIGRNSGDETGYSISGTGDVNNDGYDDLLVGAYASDGGGSDAGEAYLILGRSTTDWATLTDASGNFDLDNMSDANLTVRFIGRNSGDYLGHSISGAGDVNNDGYDDIVIGADDADGGGTTSGEAYLILGRSTTDWATLTDASGNFNLDNMSDANMTVRFIGRNSGDWLGASVSGSVDVNNDGYDDIILAGDGSDGGGSNAGEAYIVMGRSTTDWATLTDASGNFNLDNTSDANMTVHFIARNASDQLGNDPATVSGAGNVNNDGYDDIILGAWAADGGGSSSGEGYLFFGRNTASWASLTDASGDYNLDNI
jgi:hypothetical protein